MNKDASRPAGAASSLLGPDDVAPFRIDNARGGSDFVLIADHAGQAIPLALGDLGLPAHERDRHIGWDIGIAGLGLALSARLDALLISQPYSRLVIDCNRHPGADDAIAAVSDGTRIAANEHLSREQIDVRVHGIHRPYHQQIEQALDARAAAGRASVLVLLHSFTPVFSGHARPWHVGVLYHRDARLGHALLKRLREDADLVVGDNQPYSASDDADYALPVYGEARGLLHVELEIRQDLIATPAQQQHWANRLAILLGDSLATLQTPGID